MLIRCFILYLALFVVPLAHAQQFAFEKIGVRNGLPSTEVYNMFQDKYGYVWIFTEYGIVKYNGTSFVQVCSNLPLKERAIYAVNESHEGNLYIVNSNAKFYRIHKDRAYPVMGMEKEIGDLRRHGDLICDIFFDSKGGIWFASFGKTYHVWPGKYFVRGFKPERGGHDDKNKLFYFRRLINSERLSILTHLVNPDGSKKPSWLPDELVSGRMITRKTRSCEIISFVNSLFVRNQYGKVRQLEMKNRINCITIGKDNHIWVGTLNYGLYELDEKLNVLDHYFPTSTISGVLFDDQDGMWVSTIGEGVYHCKNINNKNYNSIRGLRKTVTSLRKLNNRLFVGTYNGEAYVIYNNQISQLPLINNSNPISDFAFLRNKYFIGTNLPAYATDLNYKMVKQVGGQSMSGMETCSESQLCIAYPQQIKIIEDFKPIKSFQHRKNRLLTKRKNGEFFTVSNDGICCIRGNEHFHPGYLRRLKNSAITRLRSDNQNSVWFCTKGEGIFKLDSRNRLFQFKELPAEVITDVITTDNGLMLLATNQGAFVNTLNSLNEKSKWKCLSDVEATRIEIFENNIYIGSKSGLIVMSEEKLKVDKNHKFYLKSIKVNNRKVTTDETLSLKHNQTDLYLNYDLLDFTTSRHEMVYRLTGPISQYGRVQGTEIHLQNLSPGEYELIVRPEIKFENTADLEIRTKIVINPAFWQTNAFYIIVILFSIGVSVLFSWLFMRSLSKRKRARENMERMLTEYRLTALKSQINPHFMSNSLVAIQNLILQNDTDSANLYIAKFSLLLRSLLDYSNKSAASLKSELAMIELYVELEQLRFSNKFEFEIDIAPDVDVNDTFIPTLITQPFIENAIWHGLLPLSSETAAKLTLGIRMNDRSLIISIKDNGVGRGYHKDKRTERVSKGTELIAARIETLNQLYETTGGKIEITDLKDENGMSLGTLVTIELPESILNELYENKET